MNIVFILANLILAGLYLVAVNVDRTYCLILWAVIPLVNIVLLAIKEHLED